MYSVFSDVKKFPLHFIIVPLSVSSLYEACAHAIVNRTSVYGIDRLPLPDSVKQNLKSYALTNYSGPGGRPTFMGAGGGGGISGGLLSRNSTPFYKSLKQSKKHTRQPLTPADAAKVNCGGGRKSCNISWRHKRPSAPLSKHASLLHSSYSFITSLFWRRNNDSCKCWTIAKRKMSTWRFKFF